MYTYQIEITPDYCFFAMLSISLDASVSFYIDKEAYSFSNEIVTVADSLLLHLGFIPGNIEE